MNRIVALGVSLFLAIVGIALLDGDRTAVAGHSRCSGCCGCSGCHGRTPLIDHRCHGCRGWRCNGCHGCYGRTSCCNGSVVSEQEQEEVNETTPYVPGDLPQPAPEGAATEAEDGSDAEAASDETAVNFQLIKEAVFDENGIFKYVYKKVENDKSRIANKRFERSPVTYRPAQFR